MHIALQGPVCHKVGGFWQLILSAWMYIDKGSGLICLNLLISQPGERTPP